jgi:hypothetical protein
VKIWRWNLLVPEDCDLLPIEAERVLIFGVDVGFRHAPVHCVVLEHVRLRCHKVWLCRRCRVKCRDLKLCRLHVTNHVVGADEGIVDSNQLDVISLECNARHKTSEPAEAIDANPDFLTRYNLRRNPCAHNTQKK